MNLLGINIKRKTVDALLKLAIPIVIGNILQTMYQLTDTFWVGRLGKEATAAVSLGFPVIFLLIAIGGGLPIAGSILVSQYKGQGDQKKVNHIVTQTLVMLAIISVVISFVGYYLSPVLMRASGVSAEVLPLAVSYLQVSFIGIISVFTYFVFESLMRGVGEGRIPTLIVLSTVLLNLILDPAFIMGYGPIPAMGVAGAAVATIITQTVASITGLYILFTGKYGIQIEKKIPKLDFPLIKKMFMLGLPSSVEQSAIASGLIVMSFLVATFGTVVLAAYGIGIRVFSFIIIPAFGLSIATAALVGQNIGAGDKDNAEDIAKTSAVIGFISLTLIGVITFIFARAISAIFLPGAEEALDQSTLFIQLMSLTFGFMGVQQVLSGSFRGAGNTTLAMLIAIVGLWVVNFPVAYILSMHTSLLEAGLWYSFPVSNIVGAIIVVIVFRIGKWKDRELTREFNMEEKVSEEIRSEEGLDY